jgi:hypothetical protein
MKIIFDKPGQTCNRLWSYVALVSQAISQQSKVSILKFDNTINNFPNIIQSKYIRLPYYNKLLIGLLGIDNYIRLVEKVFFNRFTHKWTRSYWGKRGKVVDGWDYRGENYDFDKNKEIIRQVFAPSEDVAKRIASYFQEIRKNYDVAIGVHIRRGDYAMWLNGRYFYELDDYHQVMLKYQSSVQDKKKVCFFISSNEAIDLQFFKGVNCYKHELSSPILDLYSLAACDGIIGPLSTYSRWASFYGETPIWVLESEDIKENAKIEFSVIKSLYLCENGKTFTNWTEFEKNENRYSNPTATQ